MNDAWPDAMVTERRPGVRTALVPVVCALVLVVPFVVGALLPFASGAYAGWLLTGAAGRAVHDLGLVAVVAGWPLGITALVVSAFLTCPRRLRPLLASPRAVHTPAIAGMVALALFVLVQFSPLGIALNSWVVD